MPLPDTGVDVVDPCTVPTEASAFCTLVSKLESSLLLIVPSPLVSTAWNSNSAPVVADVPSAELVPSKEASGLFGSVESSSELLLALL